MFFSARYRATECSTQAQMSQCKTIQVSIDLSQSGLFHPWLACLQELIISEVKAVARRLPRAHKFGE